jgi:two-component system, LytTR family, sensor kinase
MKKILLIALFFSCAQCAFGQIDFEKYAVTNFNDRAKQPIAILPAIRDNGLYTIGLELKDAYPNFRDRTFEASLKGDSILEIVDSASVHLFARGINRANAKDYEFRISDNNGKVQIAWQTIHQFTTNHLQIHDDISEGTGYLGGYKTPWNKYVVADIRKKGSDKTVASLVMYGQQIKPILLNIYTNAELDQFLSTVKLSFPLRMNPNEINGWAAKYAPNEIDESTFLPKKLIVEPNEQDLIFLLNATIFPKQALEHKIIKDGEVMSDWQGFDNYDNFISLKNLSHGEYKLLMRFAIQRHNVLEYPFKIKPKWYQKSEFKSTLWFVLIIFISLFVFLQQRYKLRKQKKQSEKIAQELKAIKSQLNPHFVFNALSSIQSLMNKQDLTSANYYLTEFSHLLRESLSNNDKENVPLSMELKTLETYIKLEQLRFPFTYSIDIEKEVDTHAIEIPYLLLQPLVENAIKHGVSNLYEKGVLSIQIYPKKEYLVVEIRDNGKGFDTEAETMGYGLKLTKERIRLLSESNGQQPVQLMLQSIPEKGVSALLLFRNWI